MSGILSSISIDDSSSNVTYVPVAQWTVHTDVALNFSLYNNTDTFSSVQNATATLIFYGDSIEYWGNQGPFHGPCAVNLDGQQVATVNSHAAADDVPILLYTTSNLTLGDHTLEIRVVDDSFPNVCEVDRFVTNMTMTSTSLPSSPTSSQTTTTTGNFVVPITSGGSTSSGESTSSTRNVVQPTTSGGDSVGSNNGGHGSEKKSITPLGAIVGAVIGGALAFLFLAFFMFLRSRKRKEKRHVADITISKPFVLDDEHSSPVPRSPGSYQTERDRMSNTASPEDRPPSTPQTATRLPAKLMTQARPRPAAFDAAQSPQSDSGGYGYGYGYQYQYEHQSGSHFASASPITEETQWQSGLATFSPTDADAKLGYEFSSPKSRGFYAVNRTSPFGSERQSGRSSAGRNDVPPPAYDEFGNDSIRR